MACQPTVLRQRKKENQGTLQRQVGIHFSSLGWNFVFIWNWTNFHYVDTKSITEQYLSFHSKWVSNSGKRLIRETDHAFEACPSPLLLLLLLSRFSRVRLCDPIDCSPPGSPVPGILQARSLEWVAISFSNAWKWKVKVKSLSRVRPSATPWTAAHQAPPSMGFSVPPL